MQQQLKAILLIGLLPLCSGAAALSHELLWTRRLVDLLGATDWVTGRVLGIFFLGLSMGGYLASQKLFRERSAVACLAYAELFVAVFSLAAAFLPAWTDWIWIAIGTEGLVSWQGKTIKALLAAAVVLPPSVAMGFTLPFFVKAATGLGGNVSTVGIWTYVFNTLGGVFGLWLTSTILIQQLGSQGTMFAVAGINVLIALVAFQMARLESKPNQETELGPTPDLSATHNFSRRQLIFLSFMSGLIVLALEVLLLRLIWLVVPGSFHTTSALLANVILFLAVASAFVSAIGSFNPKRYVAIGKWSVVFGLLAAAVFTSFCPRWLFERTDQLISIRYLQGLNGLQIESINHYWILAFWLVASVGGLALFCAGIVFPSLMSLSSESDPDGNRIGVLLAANGIGGLLGSELGNSVLIGHFGIYIGFSILAVLGLVTAATVLLRGNPVLAFVLPLVLLPFVGLGHLHNLQQPYLSPRTTKKYEIETTHFGREGVLLVVQDDKQSRSILMNNQYVLGSTDAAAVERRQLLLPWILHPEAKSVCCLGLATGISASGLENLAHPPAVTAVELSANVVRIAKQHFDEESQGFFERAENRVVVEDARTWIAAAADQFDLIVADLFRPHGVGEGRLFSIEHYQNVRRALTEDGLFCQWLPIYQLNYADFEVITTTFQRVFPDCLLVYGNADDNRPVLGLFARKNSSQWSKERLADCFARIPASLAETDSLLASVESLVVGALNTQQNPETSINTLDNLHIETSAGNFWIQKDLRKDRTDSKFENEFLSGVQIIEFNRRLKQITTPMLPRVEFEKSRQTIRARPQRETR